MFLVMVMILDGASGVSVGQFDESEGTQQMRYRVWDWHILDSIAILHGI
ncbi:hypothetical protein M3J09_010032 [Ascochyta lentis]